MSRTKHLRWRKHTWTLYLALGTVGACMTDRTVRRNSVPEANAGKDRQVAFDGSPTSVTLDGSGSMDVDGTITKFIWANADPSDVDGGPRTRGPDPDDEVKPTVELDEGQWHFQLWVKDDDNAVSAPDFVTITVGELEEAACVPERCPTPVLGEACCTSRDTGAQPGDSRGRGPDLCGTDLGGVIETLAGTCLQVDQPGDAADECPEVMGRSLEPGCCTDEGLCASLNTTAGLGCHYPIEGPGGACGGD